ncbi:MAG: DUF4251 domain-containing protein [Cyclobacteriaceae bacterium]
MKKARIILIALLMVGLSSFVEAQTDRNTTEATVSKRAEKKQHKNDLADAQFLEMVRLADQESLVLEANTLRGATGKSVQVFADNFIKIDNDQFVFQTAVPGRVGANGLGGITVDGVVTDYKVIIQPRGTVIVRANVDTHILGQATLTIRMRGNYSRATFMNNFGRTISFVGPVSSVDNAEVFTGLSTVYRVAYIRPTIY